MSKILSTYGYDANHILPTLEIIGDAGAALGMAVQDMNEVSTNIGRMNATGKTSLEYINPLQERGIDAVGALAQNYGVSKGDIYEMISDGEIAGEEAARVILRAMADSFAGAMQNQSQTMSGLQSTLEDANAELANAMGEGYNMARKEGLQEQIDFLSGETGQQMQDAYAKIGEWKAALENSKEEMQRDIMQAVMDGGPLQMDYGESQADIEAAVQEMQQQYAEAMASGNEEAGAEAGQILMRAQVLAMDAFNSSEDAQIAFEAQRTLASNIRNDAAAKEEFWNAGHEMALEYSKGLAAGLRSAPAATMGTESSTGVGKGSTYLTGGGSHAFGLDRVPYDDYPALLHEGERVLTASQAREQDAAKAPASGGQIVITGNSFSVRDDTDIQKIAAELLHQIRLAQITRKP